MPNKKPIPEECLHFASLLRQALNAAGLHDAQAIGQMVAAAQEEPERDGIPYDAAVVRAWLQGRLVPSEPAFAALTAMLSDKITPTFEYAYESAALAPSSLSELGLTLQERYKTSGYSLTGFSEALLNQGIQSPQGTPLSQQCIANIFSGARQFPADWAPVLDALLPAKEGEASFGQLVGHYHTTPGHYLEKAAATHDIHRAFRYLRRALDFSSHEMANAIAEKLPEGTKTSHVKICNWELLDSKPNAALPSRTSFPGSDPITVYGEILTDHGFGEWVQQHEGHLRTVYRHAIDARAQAGSRRIYPEDKSMATMTLG